MKFSGSEKGAQPLTVLYRHFPPFAVLNGLSKRAGDSSYVARYGRADAPHHHTARCVGLIEPKSSTLGPIGAFADKPHRKPLRNRRPRHQPDGIYRGSSPRIRRYDRGPPLCRGQFRPKITKTLTITFTFTLARNRHNTYLSPYPHHNPYPRFCPRTNLFHFFLPHKHPHLRLYNHSSADFESEPSPSLVSPRHPSLPPQSSTQQDPFSQPGRKVRRKGREGRGPTPPPRWGEVRPLHPRFTSTPPPGGWTPAPPSVASTAVLAQSRVILQSLMAQCPRSLRGLRESESQGGGSDRFPPHLKHDIRFVNT